MITDEQLNADQALCDAATEGPWTQGLGDIYGAIATGVPWSEIDAGDVKIYCKNDGTDEGFIPVADFIVAARERLPAYIAEVRRLRDAISNGRELKRCLRDYLEFCAENRDEPLDINTVDGFLNRIELVDPDAEATKETT